MKKIMMIEKVGDMPFYGDLCFLDIYLKIFPNSKKSEILELFEYCVLTSISTFARTETDEMIADITKQQYPLEHFINSPIPTYISEYVGVIGELFLGGMIDFGTICDDEDYSKIDYPTNLSYYGNSKYETWKYFRDNFFYKCAFERGSYSEDEEWEIFYYDTNWDEPNNWSPYNIWVCRTKKGIEYYEKTLAPKIYERYKDVEIIVDDDGEIVG